MCGRRCEAGLLATFCVEAELQPTTSSNTHGRCARDAGAVVTGAVHVADAIDDDQARTVLNAALEWGHKVPRKAALERLLACGDDELVQALAVDDPDASIRQWASEQLANKATQGGLFD